MKDWKDLSGCLKKIVCSLVAVSILILCPALSFSAPRRQTRVQKQQPAKQKTQQTQNKAGQNKAAKQSKQAEQPDLGLSCEDLIDRIGRSYYRVKQGVNSVSIHNVLYENRVGFTIEYGDYVSLIINRKDGGDMVKNAAVVYATALEGGNDLSGRLYFACACKQLLCALDDNLSAEQASGIMDKVGLEKNAVIDGLLRMTEHGGYRIMMRMLSNDSVIMAVTKKAE